MTSLITKTSEIGTEPHLKKKQSFLTQNSTANISSFQQIQILYSSIHSLIDSIDIKIQEVINRHESEFLIAYRHHSQRIRSQLEQIKRRAQNVQHSSNYQDKIISLQKQITLFREQSLTLYEKLETKNQQCQQYRIQLKDVVEHNYFLQQQVKKSLRKCKLMEVKLYENQSIKQKQQKSTVINRYPHQQSPKAKLQSKQIFESSQKSKNSRMSTVPRLNIRPMRNMIKAQIKDFKKIDPLSNLQTMINNQNIMNQVHKVLNSIIEQKDKKYLNLMKKYQTTLKQLKVSDKNELEQLFLNCVQSVRKDICRKQQCKPQQISLEKLKSKDQITILERFMENNKTKNVNQSEMFNNKQTYKKYNSFVN